MGLVTQQFLRSGGTLASLKEKFAINYRVDEKLGVVCLNYNQIESPVTEKIVQECRQLILELDTWNVASISFDKFFNISENKSPDFDWSNFKTYEKLDGSLITIWPHKVYGWQIATRSVPDGSSQVGDEDLTFRDLVRLTLKDMGTSFEELTQHLEDGYSYVFELMAPENQVVVHHHERKLVLLTRRSLREPHFAESSMDNWMDYHPGFPVPVVQQYEGFSLGVVMAAVQNRNPIEHEGYVLLDKNYNRVKVKSDAYCLMSYQRDGLGKSNRARLELIFSDKVDDCFALLPKLVQDKIIFLQNGINTLVRSINEAYEQIKHIETQKEFAAAALKFKFSAVLFAMRSGRVTDPLEWLKASSVKSVLGWLNVVEEEVSE